MTPSATETDYTLLILIVLIGGLIITVLTTLIVLKHRVKRHKPGTNMKVEG